MILRFCLRAIKTKLAVACIKYVVLLLDIIRTSFITVIISNFFLFGDRALNKFLKRSTAYSNPLMMEKNTIKASVCAQNKHFLSLSLCTECYSLL